MTNTDNGELTTMPSVSDTISLHYVGYTAVGELQMASISILQKPLLHLYSEFLKTGGCTARKARRLVFTDNGIRICQSNDDATAEQFFHYALITYTNTVILRTFKSHGKRAYGMFEPTLLSTYTVVDRTDTLFPLEKRFSKTENIPIFPLVTMLHRPDPPNNNLHCHAFACMSVEQSHKVLEDIKAGVKLFFEDYETLAVDDNIFSTPAPDFWKLTDEGWRMTLTRRTRRPPESEENSEPDDLDDYHTADVKSEDLALFAHASMASRVQNGNGELFTDHRVATQRTPEYKGLASDSGVESPTADISITTLDKPNSVHENIPDSEPAELDSNLTRVTNHKPVKTESKPRKVMDNKPTTELVESKHTKVTDSKPVDVVVTKPKKVPDSESELVLDNKPEASPDGSPRSNRDRPKYIRGGVRVLPVSAHPLPSENGRRRPPVPPKPTNHRLTRQNAVQESSPLKQDNEMQTPNTDTTRKQVSTTQDDDDEIWKIVRAFELEVESHRPPDDWEWEEVGDQVNGSPPKSPKSTERGRIQRGPVQKRPSDLRAESAERGTRDRPLSRQSSSASAQSDRRSKSASFEGPIMLAKSQEMIAEENKKESEKKHHRNSKYDEIEHMVSDMSTSGLDDEEYSASMMNFEMSLGYLP